MGGMCHLTAVWLFYRRPYDLVQRGEELFDRIELSFLAGGGSRGVEASRRPARIGGLSSFVRRRYHERQEADKVAGSLTKESVMQLSKQAVGEAAFIQRLSGRRMAHAPSLPLVTDEFVYRSEDRQNIFLRTTVDDEISAVYGRFKLDRPAIVHLQPGSRFLLTFYLAGNIAGEAIGRRSKPLDLRTGYAHLRASNQRRGFLVGLPAGPASFFQIRLTPDALMRVARDLQLDLDSEWPRALGAHDGSVIVNAPWSGREQSILEGFAPWEASERMMLRTLAGRGAELTCAFMRHTFHDIVADTRPGSAELFQRILAGRSASAVPARLKAVEDKTGLARSTLWRASKARHGEPPARIMRNRRLDRAFLALQSTDDTVAAIALDAGWACPSKFAAAFRRQFGRSPGATRRALAVQQKA
jgi:AraC-like DNA-binding protein